MAHRHGRLPNHIKKIFLTSDKDDPCESPQARLAKECQPADDLNWRSFPYTSAKVGDLCIRVWFGLIKTHCGWCTFKKVSLISRYIREVFSGLQKIVAWQALSAAIISPQGLRCNSANIVDECVGKEVTEPSPIKDETKIVVPPPKLSKVLVISLRSALSIIDLVTPRVNRAQLVVDKKPAKVTTQKPFYTLVSNCSPTPVNLPVAQIRTFQRKSTLQMQVNLTTHIFLLKNRRATAPMLV